MKIFIFSLIISFIIISIGASVSDFQASSSSRDSLSSLLPIHGYNRLFQRVCQEPKANLNGFLAYIETLLELKKEQQPSWDALEKVAQEKILEIAEICKQRLKQPLQTKENLPEFLKRITPMIIEIGDFLDSITPKLEELYNLLTPKQRVIIDTHLQRYGYGRRSGRRGHGHDRFHREHDNHREYYHWPRWKNDDDDDDDDD